MTVSTIYRPRSSCVCATAVVQAPSTARHPTTAPRFISLPPVFGPRPTKKGQRKAPPSRYITPLPSLRGRRRFGLGFGLRLHRSGILPFRLDVAVDELDDRDRSGIAVAEAGLEHAGIAAAAVLVAGGEHLEQFLDHGHVAHLRDRLAARVQVATLAERDQFLDDRPQVLRLRQRGDDLLMLDERRRHVGEHGAAMLAGAVELAMGVSVTHARAPHRAQRSVIDNQTTFRSLRCDPLIPVNNDPRSAWPARRYCRAANPALPCRGAAPSGPAPP